MVLPAPYRHYYIIGTKLPAHRHRIVQLVNMPGSSRARSGVFWCTVFSTTRYPPGQTRSARRRFGASEPPGMPALSIEYVRLSILLIDDSVQAARASVAISRKGARFGSSKVLKGGIDYPGCRISRRGRFSGRSPRGRRQPRAPLPANRPRSFGGTAVQSDTRGCLFVPAATAILVDGAT